MKVEVLVNLAKEAGLKVEDIMFIRRHKDAFEQFKRTVKEKPVPNAKPAEPTPQANPAQTNEGVEKSEMPVPPSPPPQPPPPSSSFSPADIDQAVEALLGPDSAPPTPPPAELSTTTEMPAGSPSSGNGTPISSAPRAHRGGSQDRKHFTFVYVSTGGNGGMDAAEVHRRDKVGREGVDAALEFEKQAGRNPTEMDHFHEGYDIESRNLAGEIERYIEVKAIGASWGQLGVTLSQPQFTTAQQLKDRYWLYVVENAGTPSQVIHRIQNPALEVKSFAYDHGWKVLAEAEIST
jgi:hypothetical protein